MPKFLDVPTWYGSSNTTLLSLWETSGTSGQVLTSNGSSAGPGWKTLPLYLHKIYITGGTAGEYAINVYSMSSATISSSSVPGLASFLRKVGCTSIDTFFVANGVATYLAETKTVVGVTADSSNDYLRPIIILNEELAVGSLISTASGVTITEHVYSI